MCVCIKCVFVFVAGWLGAMSTGVALLISPVTIAFCRRKSTRVTAVMGGLITALGCLFTSFATQFHQLFFRLALNRIIKGTSRKIFDPVKDQGKSRRKFNTLSALYRTIIGLNLVVVVKNMFILN